MPKDKGYPKNNKKKDKKRKANLRPDTRMDQLLRSISDTLDPKTPK